MHPFSGIDHVNIQTGDLEQSLEFYTGVLGFQLIDRLEAGPVKLVVVRLNDDVVELQENQQGPGQDGVVNHLALRVTDIFAAVELLKNKGLEFITAEPVATKSAFEYIFFFRGPSGEKIELVQPARSQAKTK
jgi:catechol 2,3-dioxygenase-like lactoylglutathione lyase family enzyme